MNQFCIFGIFIAFVNYECLKLLNINKEHSYNCSLHTTMDYPVGRLDRQSYSANELMRLRSLPRQWIIPDKEVLTRLKGLGILNYRGKRSGINKLNIPNQRRKQSGANFSNLIYPKRSNTLNNFKENVVCMNINCRSVVNKDVLVGQVLRDQNIDFAILTETWYSDEKEHQYKTSDLNQNGYKISVANRQNRGGGGVALTCRSGVNSRKLLAGNKPTFEFGLWQLVFKNITINCIGIYRLWSATPTQFVSEFCQFLEDVIPKYSNLLLMGDFNLHINDDSNAVADFHNCLYALGLLQHVDFPTHIHGQSLDLVITESSNGVDLISCEPGPFLSDHCAVKVVTRVQKENIVSKSINFRNFKSIDNLDFAKDLSDMTILSESADSFVIEFENKLSAILDKHAPIVEKTVIYRAPKPWCTENIKNLKRVMRRLERLWRKYKQPCDYENYKLALHKYHYALRSEKQSVLSNKVLESKGDTKKLYKFVKDLTGSKAENPMPPVENQNTLADKFADHFMEKISKIRESLKGFENYNPSVKDVEPFSFKSLSQEEVKNLISQMQPKSCELDVLPTTMLKSFVNELLPTVTKLVNLSLTQGVFPSKWKQAIVRPLLKKAGLELTYANYRPVSNLSFLSKLIEKSALLQLNKHTSEHNLLPRNQSAYRPHHSCESALLRLVNDILDGMEHKEVTALIALDLSAAFDTVDHSILLNVLECQYGVRACALKWVDSYLRPRSCQVTVDSMLSTVRELHCSVPQGSCLGPWLYLTYAGTIFDIIPPSISVYGFADDHTANKRFKPMPSDETDAIEELQKCAVSINEWMNSNKLKMNNSKTEFIMFGSRQQLEKCQTTEINICDDAIKSSDCIRYLGAFLDETLNFKEHIKRKCKTAMLNYFKIKSIRKYLSKDATETLVLSLVISHLDYCNIILYGVSHSELSKFQRIQNMCAKLILNRSKYDSSKQSLFDLHWLPIKARITFKVLVYMYNCSVGNAPSYLSDLLTHKVSRRTLRSSQSSIGNYEVPFNRNKTFSDRSFSYVGPKLWNDLPISVKSSNSVGVFKQKLKSYYFQHYFSLF